MEGSVAASSNDRLRHAVERYRAVAASQSDERIQGLFEQLLSVPASFSPVPPVKTQPEAEESAELDDQPDSTGATEKAASPTNKTDEKKDEEKPEAAEEGEPNTDSTAAALAAQSLTAPIQTINAAAGDEAKPEETTTAPVVALNSEAASGKQQATGSQVDDGAVPAVDASETVTDTAPQVEISAGEKPADEKTERVEAKPSTPFNLRPTESEKPVREAVHGEAHGKKGERQDDASPDHAEIKLAAESKPIVNDKNAVHSEQRAEHRDQHHAEAKNEVRPTESAPAGQVVASKEQSDSDRHERREKWFEKSNDPAPINGSDSPVGAAPEPPVAPAVNESPWNAGADPTLTSSAAAAPSSSPVQDNTLAAAVNLEAVAGAIAASTATSVTSSSTSAPASGGVASVAGGNSTVGSASVHQGPAVSHAGGAPSSATGGSGNTSAASKSERPDKGELAPGLAQMERVRLVQRVARSFNRLGPDGGQVTLKLHPPELGVLNMTVRIEGNTLSAKLQTESPAAQQALLENLPQLKDKLAEQGVEVTRFQVEVAAQQDWSAGAGSSSTGNGNSSSSGNESQSREVDYRRLTRNAYEFTAAAGSLRSVGSLWDSPSVATAANRSLDLEV